MKKRIMALILAALTLASLASCAESSNDSQTEAQNPGESENAVTSSAETSIYDDLPRSDLAGYNFRVLNNVSNFAYTTFGPEEQTGEILDDAIYNRNTTVEDLLNCTLTVTDMEWDPLNKQIESSVLAGEDIADIYFNEVHFQAQHALKGYITDMREIDTIDYEKPWWNMSATESLMIGDSIYFLYGDLHFMLYECYFPVAFNKNIMRDYNLGDPYELVNGGVWTLDKMSEYMTTVSRDLNGDDKMTADDQFGLGIFSHNTLGFLIASGVTLVERDSENMPYWNGLSERTQTVYSTVKQKLFGDSGAFATLETPGVSQLTGPIAEVHQMFGSGRLLFYVEPLGSMKKFRDVDFEIGLIPMPKYEESQEEYVSYIYHGAAALAIPKTNTDLSRTGIVLENLGAYSHEDVRSAYFDVTLDFKYIQDQEGQDMLDLMFANGHCELSRVYAWGTFAEKAATSMISDKTDLTTLAAQYDTKIPADIATTLEFFLQS